LILVTGHRRESLDGRLERVCGALSRIASRPVSASFFRCIETPMSGGRSTASWASEHPADRAVIIPSSSFKRCHFVVTDSGGIQEEAPSFGKPMLVTRDTTERPEAMELGLAAGGDRRASPLRRDVPTADDPEAHSRMSRIANPYGDGRASCRIAEWLITSEAGRCRQLWTSQPRAGRTRIVKVPRPSGISDPFGHLDASWASAPERLRYPSTIEANEATAAQIAAQSPSDNNNVSISADRLVRRRSATPADPTDGDASTRRPRPSLG
jgi:hypothetical protein